MNKSARISITVYLLVCMMFLSSLFALQGALLDTIIENYALQSSQSGLPNASAFLGGIAALISAFFMQGRIGKRDLMKSAMAICALSLLLLWIAPNFTVFVGVWFVLGFGLGLMDTVLSACMADLYDGKAATVMMCMLHTAFGIASMLSPIAYAALLSGGTYWQTIYMVAGVIGFALVLCGVVGKYILSRGGVRDVKGAPQSIGGIFSGIRAGRLIFPIIAMFFHGIFLSGLNTWINRYAATVGGDLGLPAMSCMFFGVMLSRMIMPFLPIRTESYVKISGFAGCAVLMVGIFTQNALALKICVAISGLLFGALIPCILSLACDRMKENTLLCTTALMLALYIGQSISSPIIGAIEAAVGLKYGIMLCAVSMAMCSLNCIADVRGR